MAESINPTDNVVNEHISEIADNIIDTLRTLNKEYDTLVKNAEERLESYGAGYEVNCKKDVHQYFVHDVVNHGVTFIEDMKRRWEEEELSIKQADIEEKIRELQKERLKYVEKQTVMERRLKIEKMKIDTINEQMKVSLVIGGNLQTTETQLNSVMDDLEKLSVKKNVYPTAILEMYSAYSQLQLRIEEMEKELLKYSNLPPDYAKARDKLTEAMLWDKELERRIRNAIK